MDRRTVEVAAVGLVCILALSLAAATLNAPTAGGAGGGAGGGGSLVLPERNATATPTAAPGTAQPPRGGDAGSLIGGLGAAFCIPALGNPLVLFGLFALVTGGILALLRTNDFTVSVTAFVLATIPGTFLALALWFTLGGCEPPTPSPADTDSQLPDPTASPGLPGGDGGGGTAAPVAPDASLLLLAVVGVAVVAAVAAIFLGSDDDAVDLDERDGTGAFTSAASVADVAAAAGEAADRIEASGEVDNEVYRAWKEMTEHLDAERPASSTPAEFREAALAAGMDREHVDTLTDLFEGVRYGGYEVTPERERRAVEALRRIEDAYGGER